MEASKQSLLTTPLKTHHPHPLAVITPDRANPSSRARTHKLAATVSKEITRVGSQSGQVKGSDKSSTVLPKMHETLCEFFNAMVSSIRLLKLKRLPAILGQLSRNIESLTDRRFTLHHLAQLKHIMPEVIVVKKIRVQDEVTSCMKEELLISLEVDAAETDKNLKGSGGFSHLKGLFRARITSYATANPEGDVPKGELPEMFYKPRQELEPSMDGTPSLRPAVLTGPTFKRRFSSEAFGAADSKSTPAKPSACIPKTPVKEATSAMSKHVSNSPTIDTDATPVKVASTPTEFVSNPGEEVILTPVRLIAATPSSCTPKRSLVKDDATPVEVAFTPTKFVSTPAAEVVSTPARLMSATPSLRTPKRSLVKDDVDDKINKSAKRKVCFEESSGDVDEQQTEVGGDKVDVEIHCSAASKDLLEVLPANLLHLLMEKERRTLEEQDPVVSETRRRQQLMAGVPKLFDMIQLLFQSVRRSVMTREELIHKILAGHLDIVDKREVEHQLKLLQEVAPEFINEKSCLSGDALLSVNKASCADSIRLRLLAAK